MDVETAILIITAIAGFGAVVQHFYDRYSSKGLYKSVQVTTATALQTLPSAIGVELKKVFTEMSAEALQAQERAEEAFQKSGKMSIVRGAGIAKAESAEVSRMLIENIAGPVLEGLKMFMPNLAEQISDLIETDPDKAMRLWELAQRNPWFQKHVAPRLNQYLAGLVGGTPPAQEPGGASGWGP